MSVKATKFNRIFHPEFLQSRRDITPLEMACAMGKFDEVVEGIKEDESVLFRKNRDGNTLLLFAVANNHFQIADILLQMKSNINTTNSMKLNALDYAVMESIRSPMAKVVISNCDYVIGDVFEGPYERSSRRVIVELVEDGLTLASTTLCGRTPDFSRLFDKESDYRKEWLSNFKYMVQVVRKGVLLLSCDIDYIERDALFSGALEIPVNHRYLYSPGLKSTPSVSIIKFSHFVTGAVENTLNGRLIKAASNGTPMAMQGLLKARVDPLSESFRGEPAILCACHNGEPQTIKCLLLAKAQVNTTNKDGYSGLHIATVRNNAEAVSVLLAAKADLFARTHKGNSVLDFVKHENHGRVLELLQQARDARKDALKEVKYKVSYARETKGGLSSV